MKGHTVPREELRNFIDRPRISEEWFRVTQERIDQFADATLDHQFIHVDPVRAAQTPFGGTVAHGFLTLSLLPRLLEPIQVVPENTIMGINYGLNRVRFPNPVPVDSEIRATARLREISESPPDRVTLTTEVTIEIRGQERPALVAESLAMFIVAPQPAEHG
jgi:acyl dehydratase